ncbi:MAG TPA: GNAT family N-acetyltransferase, partial [Ktedonobacterales bacterium]|nr:GNAT family N-acetyltransferase [Ktedonobacterales bacterium]
RISNGQTWVACDGNRIVGVLVLEVTPEGFLLNNVAVQPECQGKGYGRLLIEFAEAEARRRGFSEIILYTHAMMTENIALYGRIGFVEVRRVNEKGYDRVYMTKRL